jgi:hypothetical protein
MPESCYSADHINVDAHRPACPKCDALMMLARIAPVSTGFDLRTFECPQCDSSHEITVESIHSISPGLR